MRIQDLDIDTIQRRNREALAFATEQVGGSEYAPEAVLEHFNDDVPALVDALGRAFAVIRQNAITQVNQERKLAEASRIVEAARAWRQDVDPRYGEASAEALCKAVDELDRATTRPNPYQQYGHGGQHHGRGTPDCPVDLHHHHDERCEPPTATAPKLTEDGSEPATCLGPNMDCGRPLPCPDHPTGGGA